MISKSIKNVGVIILGFLTITIIISSYAGCPKLTKTLQVSTSSLSHIKGFIVGVNGHPLTQPDYISVPVITQVKYMKSLGLSYYRIDVYSHEDGSIVKENIFLPLAKYCAAYNIKILPVISPSIDSFYKDSKSAYYAGEKLAKAFAVKYKQYFSHYELGNEFDLKALKSPSLPGKDASDYDKDKIKIIAAYLDGLNSGVKSADPTAKTIINMCGPHSGFMKMLKAEGVHFDIIGQHFYATESFDSSKSFLETNKELLEIYAYTKPIWITEFNRWLGSSDTLFGFNTEDAQKTVINDFIQNCGKSKYNKAIFIYELLDEPNLQISQDKQYEKNFGVIKKVSGNWQLKLAGKHLLKRYRQQHKASNR